MEKEKLILINLEDTSDILVIKEHDFNIKTGSYTGSYNCYVISVEKVIRTNKIETEYFIDFEKCIDECCCRAIVETDLKIINKILKYLKYGEEPKFKNYIFEDKRKNKETRGQLCMDLDTTYWS